MTRQVGVFAVTPLVDASGAFFLPRHAAFPDATEADRAAARSVDPAAFDDGEAWLLDFRCFLVRDPRGRTTLVDAGVGPAAGPAAAWAPVPGRLPDALTAAGLDPAEVDTVVLTHLHEDHVGWSVAPDGAPTFPNARYVVQRREIDALPAGDATRGYVIQPLRAAGQLDLVDGERRLSALEGGGTLTVVPTPGHTPGHQSVLVEAGPRQVLITGDVHLHAVQLVNPDVGYRFDADQDLARRTRSAVLARARRDGVVLAVAHPTRAFLELPGEGPLSPTRRGSR